MSDHEEMENVVAAWVLGAADPDESEAVALHLDGCSGCRAMASRLRRVVDAVALDVDEVEPPARLRQRILDAAASSPRISPAPARSRDVAIAIPKRRRSLGIRLANRIPVYAAAAAVLVAVTVGILAGDIAGRSTPTAPSSEVARFTLTGHESMAGAHGTVLDLKSDGIALIDFGGLPSIASGQVYELWLIGPNSRVDPAGVFVPDSNGSKVVVVGKPLAGYTTIAVTVEQGPAGVLAPTQQPQLAGSLA
ncbi:MAG: anti-sigma factor domain-containing protein [Candidatus Dormibacterales bacterium]